MSENLKKVLYNKGIEITFIVEGGVARVEYRSNGEFDLSDADDVVLFVNGDHVRVQSFGADHASGEIGDWSRFGGTAVNLMTRVGEFFDGWELDP